MERKEVAQRQVPPESSTRCCLSCRRTRLAGRRVEQRKLHALHRRPAKDLVVSGSGAWIFSALLGIKDNSKNEDMLWPALLSGYIFLKEKQGRVLKNGCLMLYS